MIIAAKKRDVALLGLPDTPAGYAEDVAPIVTTTRARYGESEWRAVVLTHELHGHLGLYSLLGAKMGIRALEEFGEEEHPLSIGSYAGQQPPISCLNDGLQVATGSTFGHGLIRLLETEVSRPEAEFRTEKRGIRIALCRERLEQLQCDIAEGILQHGERTPAYWRYIRSLAIRYWQEWDRHTIFSVERL